MIPALASVLLLVPAADPPKLTDAAEKELKKLEGKWKVQRMATAGKEHTLGPNDPEFIGEFRNGKWVYTGVEKAVVVSLDHTTDPKCLDLKSIEEGRNGVVDEAIYKLDGDTLTICFYQGKGKQRPTGFDVPKERDTILIVMKRVKE